MEKAMGRRRSWIPCAQWPWNRSWTPTESRSADLSSWHINKMAVMLRKFLLAPQCPALFRHESRLWLSAISRRLSAVLDIHFMVKHIEI
jgi:hypothetical protein